MAERWQQWMPFHIDRFRGSPDVQAMHPAARMGYLYLLASAWQTDDCTVPDDALDLAALSGLGDELWALYGLRILRKFASNDQGKLINHVLHDEWREAKGIFDHNRKVKSEAGKIGNAIRWGRTCDKKPSQNVRTPIAEGSQNIATTTGTGTGTKTEEQKPSRAKKPREVTKTEIAKSRHAEFKAAVLAYWQAKNPGVEMPWGPAEGRNLEMWLRESPTTSLDAFTGYLRHRFKSEVNHAERPSRWIASITSFAGGAIDRFGKPLTVASKPTTAVHRNDAQKAIAEHDAAKAQWERENLESRSAPEVKP